MFNKVKNFYKLFLIIFYTNSLLHAHYSILFVHLGNQIPVYSKYSLQQARLFNPSSDIYMIVNKGAIKNQEDIEIINNNNIKIYYCEDLIKSEEHKQFLITNSLDRLWREGFWQKVNERFFIVEEFISLFELNNVFHLENDVMLYINLENYMPIFQKYQNIAAVFDNDVRVHPNFMYIKSYKSLKPLTEFMEEKSKFGYIDMQILSLYNQIYGPDYLSSLPLIMPDYEKIYGFKSISGHTVKNKEIFTLHFDEFQSIFDGSALGQYLGGRDPILGSETSGFINKSSLYNPSYFDYKWVYDEKNRKCPYIVFNDKSYKINTLHIHSKRLELFKS